VPGTAAHTFSPECVRNGKTVNDPCWFALLSAGLVAWLEQESRAVARMKPRELSVIEKALSAMLKGCDRHRRVTIVASNTAFRLAVPKQYKDPEGRQVASLIRERIGAPPDASDAGGDISRRPRFRAGSHCDEPFGHEGKDYSIRLVMRGAMQEIRIEALVASGSPFDPARVLSVPPAEDFPLNGDRMILDGPPVSPEIRAAGRLLIVLATKDGKADFARTIFDGFKRLGVELAPSPELVVASIRKRFQTAFSQGELVGYYRVVEDVLPEPVAEGGAAAPQMEAPPPGGGRRTAVLTLHDPEPESEDEAFMRQALARLDRALSRISLSPRETERKLARTLLAAVAEIRRRHSLPGERGDAPAHSR